MHARRGRDGGPSAGDPTGSTALQLSAHVVPACLPRPLAGSRCRAPVTPHGAGQQRAPRLQDRPPATAGTPTRHQRPRAASRAPSHPSLTLQAHKHDHVGLALFELLLLGVAPRVQHGAQLVKHRLRWCAGAGAGVRVEAVGLPGAGPSTPACPLAGPPTSWPLPPSLRPHQPSPAAGTPEPARSCRLTFSITFCLLSPAAICSTFTRFFTLLLQGRGRGEQRVSRRADQLARLGSSPDTQQQPRRPRLCTPTLGRPRSTAQRSAAPGRASSPGSPLAHRRLATRRTLTSACSSAVAISLSTPSRTWVV